MRNQFSVLLAVLAVLLVPAIQAAELKVGVVNNVRLFQESPQAEAASIRLREEFQPREAKLFSQEKNIKAQEERLKRDGAVMSAEARDKLEREIKNAWRELQLDDSNLKEEFAARQQQEMAKLREELTLEIQNMAKEEGFDLILYDGVTYVTPSLDVTEKVLSRLKAAAAKK